MAIADRSQLLHVFLQYYAGRAFTCLPAGRDLLDLLKTTYLKVGFYIFLKMKNRDSPPCLQLSRQKNYSYIF